MAIESISSTAAPLAEVNPNTAKAKFPTTAATAATASDTGTAATATPGATAPAAAAAAPAAPIQSEAAAVSTATATLNSTYSTTVGGKSYSADVSDSNGTYTLSVPGLAGATVSASSLSTAENELGVKIDTLV